MADFWRRRLDAEERYGLRLTLFLLAVAVFGVAFGYLLDQVVRSGPLVRADTSAARGLHTWVLAHGSLVRALKVVTVLGTSAVLLPVTALACFYVWRHGRNRLVWFLVTTSIGDVAIDDVVKHAVSRNRPSLVDPVATAVGKSFPSGHAMNVVAIVGALVVVFLPVIRSRRGAIAGWIVFALLIGFTRLALGVHYISDVLGGYALGAAWLTASVAAFEIYRADRGLKAVIPTKGVEPDAKRALGRSR